MKIFKEIELILKLLMKARVEDVCFFFNSFIEKSFWWLIADSLEYNILERLNTVNIFAAPQNCNL